METDWKKKYEEALNKARELNGTVAAGRDFLAEIFPELAESEDERIRKKIIELVKNETGWLQEFSSQGQCLAYLEKQKARERLDRMAPIYNDKESFESALEKAWKYYNESASRTVDSFEDNYIECVFSKGFREGFLYKEKQKEPKSSIFPPGLGEAHFNPISCKQKEQTEELSTRLNGLMQEYVKSGKDEEEQEHRLKCYQLFWDALGDSEFFEREEQKEIPLMNGNTDLYFDEWNQQKNNPTKRQYFEEGIRYAQRLQKEQEPILEVFGFKVGDAVRLKDGDGRKHIIKSFEEVKGIHGPNFYLVEFEDNSARDGIYPGEKYPNGYYTQMEKFEEEQKPNYCHYGGDPNIERCKCCSATCSGRLADEQKLAECSEVELTFRGEKVKVKRQFFHDDKGRKYSTTEQDEDAAWYALRAWCEKKGVSLYDLYPREEWSEEDEKQIRQIERIVKNAGCSKMLQEKIHNWLKSLQKRFSYQTK